MEISIPYFDEFSKYFSTQGDQSIQERTLDDYYSVLSAFYSFLISHQKNYLDPINIKSGDIRRYIAYLQDEKQLKHTTINKHISKIKGYFDFLEQISKVGADPAAKIKRLPLEFKRKWVDIEQVQIIMQQAMSDITVDLMDKVIVILAANGVRGPEMVSSEFANALQFTNDDVKIHLQYSTISVSGIAAQYIKELHEQTERLRNALHVNNLFFIKKQKSKNITDIAEQYSTLKTVDISPKMNRLSKKLGIDFTLKAIELGYMFHKMDTTSFENIYELQRVLGISEINFKSIVDAYKAYKAANITE